MMRGHTLIELIVAAALSLLVTLLVVAFLWQTVRATAQAGAQASLCQQAVLLGRRLAEDLEETNAAGVAVHPSDGTQTGYVAVHPIVDVDPRARPVYATTRLVLYAWSPELRELTRAEWTEAPPLPLTAEEPVRLTRAQCQAALASPGGVRERRGQVRLFEVQPGELPGPNVEAPFQLRIEAAAAAVAGRPEESYLYDRALTLRSQL